MQLVVTTFMLGAMWFLLIRPQQQRVKAQRALLQSLVVGDEVVTVGGIIGHITELRDDRVSLAVSPTVELTVLRPAISQRVPAPGTDGTLPGEDA